MSRVSLISISMAAAAYACAAETGPDSVFDIEATDATTSDADAFRPVPQIGETCEYGEGPCCWTRDGTRAVECSAPGPGFSGRWTLQFHSGCPCSADSQCRPTPMPPPCDRIPAE